MRCTACLGPRESPEALALVLKVFVLCLYTEQELEGVGAQEGGGTSAVVTQAGLRPLSLPCLGILLLLEEEGLLRVSLGPTPPRSALHWAHSEDLSLTARKRARESTPFRDARN